MAKEWVDHEQGLVGEIDCTVETKFCHELKIEGLPHLYFGEPSGYGVFLQEFGGEKSVEVLSQFAKETLTTKFCSAGNLDACDGEELYKLQYYLSISVADLESLVQQSEEKIEQAEAIFQSKFAEMQKEYDFNSNQFALVKSRIKKKMDLIMDVLKTKENSN